MLEFRNIARATERPTRATPTPDPPLVRVRVTIPTSAFQFRFRFIRVFRFFFFWFWSFIAHEIISISMLARFQNPKSASLEIRIPSSAVISCCCFCGFCDGSYGERSRFRRGLFAERTARHRCRRNWSFPSIHSRKILLFLAILLTSLWFVFGSFVSYALQFVVFRAV